MDRPEYALSLVINDHPVKRVLIDQHYRQKHGDLNDQIILDLVKKLDGQNFPVEITRGDYDYFRAEPVILQGSPYRLVMVLCVSDDFLGVVNAFRVDRK
jgi:hypothetical protein